MGGNYGSFTTGRAQWDRTPLNYGIVWRYGMFLKSLVNKLRYLVWASPIVWLTLLNGCGSGTVLDPFTPTRIIAFGDAYMDVRTPRFTVNDEITTTLTSTTDSYTYLFNGLFSINGYISSLPISMLQARRVAILDQLIPPLIHS